MEERQILILDVAGSNPAGVAILKGLSPPIKCDNNSPLAQMEERQILILDVAGSNPAGVATLKKVSRYLKCELEIKGDICQKLQISK